MDDRSNQESTQVDSKSPTTSSVGSQVEVGIPEDGSAVASNSNAEKDRDSEFERCEKELVEYKDRYLRTVAEMDNMRKRLEREKQDFLKYSSESILKDMIPILDSLDKALPTDKTVEEATVEKVVAEFAKGYSLYGRLLRPSMVSVEVPC
jgi:molecular chaperone GrpE (heat shock protein)